MHYTALKDDTHSPVTAQKVAYQHWIDNMQIAMAFHFN